MVSAPMRGIGNNEPLRPGARKVIAQMKEQGIILDVTHLLDSSFYEAIDCWMAYY